jgi:hypothetical protein
MPIPFRKASIRSRRRTLGLAGLGLIVETIASHPRVDVTAMVNVATMSRLAVAPVMASLGGLSWTAGPRSDDPVGIAPAAGPARMAWLCGRKHLIAS